MITRHTRLHIIIAVSILCLIELMQTNYVQNFVVNLITPRHITINIHKTDGIFPFSFTANKVTIKNTNARSITNITNLKASMSVAHMCIKSVSADSVLCTSDSDINIDKALQNIQRYIKARIRNLKIKQLTFNNINIGGVKISIDKHGQIDAYGLIKSLPISISGAIKNNITLSINPYSNPKNQITARIKRDLTELQLSRGKLCVTGNFKNNNITGTISYGENIYVLPYTVTCRGRDITFLSSNILKTQPQSMQCNNTSKDKNTNTKRDVQTDVLITHNTKTKKTEIKKMNAGFVSVKPFSLQNYKADEAILKIKDATMIINKINITTLANLFGEIRLSNMNAAVINQHTSGLISARLAMSDGVISGSVSSDKLSRKNITLTKPLINFKYTSSELEAQLTTTIMNNNVECNIKTKHNNWIINGDSEIRASCRNKFIIHEITNTRKILADINYDLACDGKISKPRIKGTLMINDAEFKNINTETYLRLCSGTIEINGPHITIKHIAASDIKKNPGTISASGHINLSDLSTDINIDINKFSPYIRKNLFYAVSGKINLSGKRNDRYDITGALNANDITVHVGKQSSEGVQKLSPVLMHKKYQELMKYDICRNTHININLSSDKILVQNSTNLSSINDIVLPQISFNTKWRTKNTYISGTLHEPIINLGASVDEGTLNVFGTQMEITEGSFELNHATLRNINNATSNIRATTNIDNYKLRINFDYRNKKTNITLESTPQLSNKEIISYILFKKPDFNIYNNALTILLSATNRITNNNNTDIISKIYNTITDGLEIQQNKDQTILVSKAIESYKISVSHDIDSKNNKVSLSKKIGKNLDIIASTENSKNTQVGLEWRKRF